MITSWLVIACLAATGTAWVAGALAVIAAPGLVLLSSIGCALPSAAAAGAGATLAAVQRHPLPHHVSCITFCALCCGCRTLH